MSEYCIQHLLHVRVTAGGPSLAAAAEMLSGFPTGCERPAPLIRLVTQASGDSEWQEAVPLVSDHRRRSAGDFRVAVGEGGEFTLFMPRDESIEPELHHHIQMHCRFVLSPVGATVVKAAALEHQGRGILVCGERGSGKTSAALLPLFDPSFRYMSDDISIIHSDGTIHAFPKPLWIPGYLTEALAPSPLDRHSYIGRARVDRLVRLVRERRRLHTLARMARWILMQRQFTRRWAQEVTGGERSVALDALFPDHARAMTAPAYACLFIRPGAEPAVEEVSVTRATSYLAALTLHRRGAPLLSEYARADAIDLPLFLQRLGNVWSGFAQQVPFRLRLTVPPGSPRAIQQAIMDVVSTLP